MSFADIGDFIYQPVKTYSTGMFVRLAFAVAINVEPDILIVDEALSVGDFRFKRKCMRKFDDFMSANKTILFVTHDHGSVIQYCTRAIWLKDGAVQDIGSPQDVCKEYITYMSYSGADEGGNYKNTAIPVSGEASAGRDKIQAGDIEWDGVEECSSFGEGGAEILGVRLIFLRVGNESYFWLK